MATPQQPVLLAPKVPLVDADGRMNRDWYSFLASRLKLLGTGNTSIDDILVLLGVAEEAPLTVAIQAQQTAEDNAVLLAFAG